MISPSDSFILTKPGMFSRSQVRIAAMARLTKPLSGPRLRQVCQHFFRCLQAVGLDLDIEPVAPGHGFHILVAQCGHLPENPVQVGAVEPTQTEMSERGTAPR